MNREIKEQRLFFGPGPKISKRPLRAQTTLECVAVVVCVVAALLAMQIYFKRSVQGRLKDNADNIGKQYDPASSASNISYVQDSDSTSSTQMYIEDEKVKTVTTVTINSSSTNQSGTESVGNLCGG